MDETDPARDLADRVAPASDDRLGVAHAAMSQLLVESLQIEPAIVIFAGLPQVPAELRPALDAWLAAVDKCRTVFGLENVRPRPERSS